MYEVQSSKQRSLEIMGQNNSSKSGAMFECFIKSLLTDIKHEFLKKYHIYLYQIKYLNITC